MSHDEIMNEMEFDFDMMEIDPPQQALPSVLNILERERLEVIKRAENRANWYQNKHTSSTGTQWFKR